MTTEGGISYETLMQMSDVERLWWVQRCIEHNEALEARLKNPRG